MRYTQAFIPTLKEAPAEATQPSHVLLLRGGFVRQVGAGIYDFLPLGHRVLTKVAQVVRQEMNAAGAQEVLMPGVLPAEYLKESGRWEGFGEILLKVKDRKQNEYALGPTHEEIITDMVRRDVRSYRQLPINLYQIQMKFRDEARPRAGLLRCREFLMKDAYSFDQDAAGALASYATMREAYRRIFTRLGLDFRIVAADSGAMGGDTSAEFQILAQTGEDDIVACGACDFAANVEVAPAAPPAGEAAAPAGTIEKIATPGAKTIEAVVTFLNSKKTLGDVDASRLLKSLVYVAGGEVVLVVVRGDHQVNEVKLAKVLGVPQVFLATEADVAKGFGTPVGFVGPVESKVRRIVADHAVAHVSDGVCGANEKDVHLGHVAFGRDFTAELADVRAAKDGDPCPKCGAPLKAYRGIEGGHIFVLGTHYSAKMGATFLDDNGESKPIVMGCYGIGVSRLVAAAIEQHHDADGILWPMPIAPYHVVVTTIGKDEEVVRAGQTLHDALAVAGVDVLFDDRDERPGVKFKDADLLGIPLRATVGAKGLARGMVELKSRDAKASEDIAIGDAATVIAERVRAALAAAMG